MAHLARILRMSLHVRHAATTRRFDFASALIQPWVSLPDFLARCCSGEQRAAAPRAMRSPVRLLCPRCDCMEHDGVCASARWLFQCQSRLRQTLPTAGTVLGHAELPMRTWYLAVDLISQDATGLSSLAHMRHLGTSCRTAWLLHHKLVAAMAEHDAPETLAGDEQLDDACFGGERPSVAGRGSPHKVSRVAADFTGDAGRTRRVELAAVGSVTRVAIASWAKANLLRGCPVRSDVLNCFSDVIDEGSACSYIVVVQRWPRGFAQCCWVDTPSRATS